jgi:hypothetical protein
VQLDGSPFAWLEERGPAMTLLGAIDDATSQVLALHFRPTEDLHGYATLLHHVFTDHGLPLALYGDGVNILVRTDRHWRLEEELAGAQAPTHLGRVLQDLGIAYVQARSPQGKGRIERLWGTLQDRLVSELRVQRIHSRELANAFLPDFVQDFNRRFARPPMDPHPVWRRPPPALPLILSCRYRRVVARDNTIRLGPRCIQLPPGPHRRSWARARVEVRELLDGRAVVLADGRPIATQPAPSVDFTLRPRRDPNHDRHRPAPTGSRSSRPLSAALSALADALPPPPRRRHPWRRPFSRNAPSLTDPRTG